MQNKDVPKWLEQVTSMIKSMIPEDANFVIFVQQMDETKGDGATNVNVQMNCCPCQVINDVKSLTEFWAGYIEQTHGDKKTELHLN